MPSSPPNIAEEPVPDQEQQQQENRGMTSQLSGCRKQLASDAATAVADSSSSNAVRVESLSPKFNAGILGATGSVGQQFIALLHKHPWIEIVLVGASERSVGKKYKDACTWRITEKPLPSEIGEMEVLDAVKDETKFIESCDLIFSALSSQSAKATEANLAAAGLAVFSNAAAHRYDADVPILIPHVNASHLQLIKKQPTFQQQGGFIITNANCTTTGLCVALKPLVDKFGVDKVVVATLQAVSGAGYPGISWWDIQGNVIPNIAGEEIKIEKEPKKILGTLIINKQTEHTMGIENHHLTISAMTHRVPVLHGHTISVSVKFSQAIDTKTICDEVTQAYHDYNQAVTQHSKTLPTMPEICVKVLSKDDEPQPRLHVLEGNGMTVCVGRIRPCSILDVKLVILCNNTILGAAGGSITNAEYAIASGILR